MLDNAQPRRSWYQFSLRTIFVLMTLACILLAFGGSSLNWVRRWQENRRIAAVLEQPTTLICDGLSLFDIADHLKTTYGIDVQISVGAFPEPHEGITCNLSGVQLKTALEEILKPRQRTFIVSDGVLCIVTEAEIQGTGP